jgi:hemolysin III
MTNPVRGLLHGASAVAFLIAALALVSTSPAGLGRRVSLLAFGLSLVALFTTSSLYHSIPWREEWKGRMQRLDHTMIFVLVAGTFTPIAVIVLEGWIRWATLAIQWGIVLVGAVRNVLIRRPGHAWSVALATTQGWLALFIFWPMGTRLPWTALATIAAGGILYTVGMLFLVTGRPRLWPRVFSYHEAFPRPGRAGGGDPLLGHSPVGGLLRLLTHPDHDQVIGGRLRRPRPHRTAEHLANPGVGMRELEHVEGLRLRVEADDRVAAEVGQPHRVGVVDVHGVCLRVGAG